MALKAQFYTPLCAKKKYKAHNSKYVRPISKYKAHIFPTSKSR